MKLYFLGLQHMSAFLLSVAFMVTLLTIFPTYTLANELTLHKDSAVVIAASNSDPFDRDGEPGNVGLEFRPPIPQENCFWVTTVSLDHFYNSYYTDQQAYYPSAAFSVPQGGYVNVTGDFPRARSMTFTAYHFDPDVPTKIGSSHQIKGPDIKVRRGSLNPFVEGTDRTTEKRSYVLMFVPKALPENVEDRKPNTLYLGNKEFPGVGYIVVMRVYLPDKGTNFLGGTTLPETTFVMPDRTKLTGKELCSVSSFTGNIPFPSGAFDESKYLQARDNPNKPNTWPAQNPPYINRDWNLTYNFCLNFVAGLGNEADCGKNPGNDPNGPGFANPSNAYLSTWIDRKLGEVLVLRGKKPKTPTTYFGDPTLDTSDAQLLYFSWTTQESLRTWRAADSVFDEEIPVDQDGYYTIVISRPSYRPKNARFECGYSWLEFPAAGDGAGDLHLATLWSRWQNPLNGFDQAPQFVDDTGDESKVMGEYFPTGKYMSTDEFDKNFPCQQASNSGG